MAVTIAELTATLRMDIAQFQSAVANANALADKMKTTLQGPQTEATKLGGILNALKSPLDSLGLSFQKLAHIGIEPIAALSPTLGGMLTNVVDKAAPATLAVAGLAGAAVGVGATLFSFAKSAGESANEIQLFGQRTGFSTTAIQGLRTETQLTGGSLEDLNSGIRAMQDFIGRAAAGETTAAQGMRDLGLEIRELVRLAPDQQFEAIAKAVNTLPPGFQQTSAGIQVFGRGFAALVPTMQSVATDGIQGVVDRASTLGTVLDKTTVEQGARFDRWLTETGIRLKALATQFGAFLVSGPGSAVSAPPGSILAGQFGSAGQEAPGSTRGNRAESMPPVSGTVLGAPLDSQIRAVTQLQGVTDAAVREMRATQLQASGDIIAAENQRFENARQQAGIALNAELERIQRELGAQQNAQELMKQSQLEAVATFIAKEQELESAHTAGLQKIGESAIGAARAAVEALQPIDKESQRIREVILESFGPSALGSQGLRDTLKGFDELSTMGKELQGLQAIKVLDPENARFVEEVNQAMTALIEKMREVAQQAGISGAALQAFLGGGAGGGTPPLVEAAKSVSAATDAMNARMGEYIQKAREAREAGTDLELQLTGKSLDTSFDQVASATERSTSQIDSWLQTIETASVTSKEFAQAMQNLAAGFDTAGGAGKHTPSTLGAEITTTPAPSGPSRLDQALLGPSVNAGSSLDATSLAMAVLGLITIPRAGIQTGRGSALTPEEAKSMLATVLEQQRVDANNQTAAQRLIAQMTGSGKTAGGFVAPVTVNTTVNMNGLSLSTPAQLQQFAGQIGGIVADQQRRGLSG